MDKLVGIAKHNDFSLPDFANYHAAHELSRLDDAKATDDAIFSSHNWRKSSVSISLPKEGQSWPSETDAPTFSVELNCQH